MGSILIWLWRGRYGIISKDLQACLELRFHWETPCCFHVPWYFFKKVILFFFHHHLYPLCSLPPPPTPFYPPNHHTVVHVHSLSIFFFCDTLECVPDGTITWQRLRNTTSQTLLGWKPGSLYHYTRWRVDQKWGEPREHCGVGR